MATLFDALPAAGSSTAIIVPSKSQPLDISYSRLRSHISAFQTKLARIGISSEAAVSITLPNSYEFIVAFLAISWQRAIAAPLNPAYKQDEFEFYMNDLGSAIVLVPEDSFQRNGPVIRAASKHNVAIAECHWNGAEVVLDVKNQAELLSIGPQHIQRAQSEDTALILHTSGTTGRPKAVPLTHRNLTKTMQSIKETYQLSSADRTLLVMPLFHVHGLLAGFLSPLVSSGSVILPSRFAASDFWDHFIRHSANWYSAVPTIHQILLRSPRPKTIPSIRFIRSSSSPLSPKTLSELEHAFNAPVLEAYAMTEGAHQITSNPLPPAKRLPGSVGIAQGVELRIFDQTGNTMPLGAEGEICVKGENITKGYLNNPEANATSFTRDGFFKTGDQGKQDKDGYVIITGRIKELINKGGEKISPVEVDNIVVQHPAVSEAVSFAIADETYGEDLGLAVVLKDNSKVSADELREWVTGKVAKFKVPKQVYFTEVMPKTATGKVQRKTVAEIMLKQQRPRAKI